jgi:hypothetical protein
MDRLLSEAFENFAGFSKNHLEALPGKSPLSLNINMAMWDWNVILNPSDFEWKVGTTPLADLAVFLCTYDR